MNECEQCRITTRHGMCPLCNGRFSYSNPGLEDDFYPSYDGKVFGKRQAPQIAVFAGITLILACIFINLIAMPHFLWFFHATGLVVYGVISLNHTILSKSPLGSKIVGQVVSLTLLFLLMDSQSGFLKWSINYAVPFLIVGGLVMVTLSMLTSRLKWKGHVSLTTMIALSFLPAAFYFSGYATVIWPSAFASFYAFMLTSGFGMFARQTVWAQLSRRLHI